MGAWACVGVLLQVDGGCLFGASAGRFAASNRRRVCERASPARAMPEGLPALLRAVAGALGVGVKGGGVSAWLGAGSLLPWRAGCWAGRLRPPII